MWAYGFRFYFTPLSTVLFTFPSRYWFTIGLSGVFSLAGWCRPIQTGFLRSRPTQGTRVRKLPARTGPSPSTARLPRRFRSAVSGPRGPYNPGAAVTAPVWALPVSLATTPGIIVIFSSSGYLDVSVPRVRPLPGTMPPAWWVAPFGNLRIDSYLRIPADYRSLSRPSSPLRA